MNKPNIGILIVITSKISVVRSAGASSGDKMIEDENQNKFCFVIQICIGHEDVDHNYQ